MGSVPTIVALGDAAIDLFVRPDGAIVHGSDVGGTVRLLPGGSAANVAVWAARCGAEAHFIGAVGADPAAELLRTDFAREGVTARLQVVDAPTASIAVLVDGDGERAMIADRGAALLLEPGHLAPVWLPLACRLHVPAYSLFAEPLCAAAMRAAELCRAAGGRVSVDTSSVGPLQLFGRDRFLSLVARLAPDILFANHAEGCYLSGSDAAETGIARLRRHADLVIWKLGGDGAMALGVNAARVPGERVAVLDSTGAGDAFAAAFLAAVDAGDRLPEALARANGLAARVVQHLGARPSMDAGPRHSREVRAVVP